MSNILLQYVKNPKVGPNWRAKMGDPLGFFKVTIIVAFHFMKRRLKTRLRDPAIVYYHMDYYRLVYLGLDELMAVMKSRYVQFIEQMQSAEYAEMLQHKINEERLRGHLLRNKVHEVRTEIRQLEKHFVHIFNSRLNEVCLSLSFSFPFSSLGPEPRTISLKTNYSALLKESST